MRIIPFPTRELRGAEDEWLLELDAALDGSAQGPAAGAWRELREDVRSLAPAMTGDFERELAERIAREHAPAPARRRRLPSRLARLGRLGERPALAAALSSALAIVLAAALLVQPWSGRPAQQASPRAGVSRIPDAGLSTPGAPANAPAKAASEARGATASSAAPAQGATTSSGSSVGRRQQRAASVTLESSPADVQATADGVARLATSEGGYVQSSQVHVQQGSGGAEIKLSVPSAKLDSALAALAALAPLRAESQSLQDITNSYEAAKRRLSDLSAERQALLRALSAASTQGQIDSLRERLTGVAQAIAQAQAEVQTVARQAANSEVEVSIEGNAHATGEGFTVHRGLREAGHVLLFTLTVVLVGGAVLVPLALLLALLLGARRAFLDYRRERVLDTR